MPLSENNEASKEFEEGSGQAAQIAGTGIDAAKKSANAGKSVIKNGRRVARAGKKAAEIGGKAAAKAGEVIAEKGGEVVTFLAANPEITIPLAIIIILVIAIIITLSLSGAWMTKDSKSMFAKKPYYYQEDRDKAYEEIIDIVEVQVETPQKKAVEAAEDACKEYIEENFNDYDSEVVYEVMTDTPEEVAKHITPYILAVNGAIQYEEDEYAEEAIKNELNIFQLNEYNTIGKKFEEVVGQYAESKLFYVDFENVIDDVELVTVEVEEPILDKVTGLQRLDADGIPMVKTYEKEVYQGTVYIGIGYYIGDYKKADIEDAIDKIYDYRKDYTATSRETYADYVKEYIYDNIYEETGTREYNLWGGYGQGILLNLQTLWNIDFEHLNLDPGSIEALMALTGHGIQADWALLDALEEAQRTGKLTMKSRTGEGYPYCTEWAHFFMYLAYGKDYNTNPGIDGGDGNGANIARTLAMRYSDEWYRPDDGLPTAGAIFSITGINNGAGHVGIITRVEGDRIWYCDGNLTGSDGKSHGYNTRVNVEVSLSDFMHRADGGTVYFANHR